MEHESQCLDFWPTGNDFSLSTLDLLVLGMVCRLSVRNSYWGDYLRVVKNADRVTLWVSENYGCDQFWQELINMCACAYNGGVLTAVSGGVEFNSKDGGQEMIEAGPGYHMERLVRKRVASWGVEHGQVKEQIEGHKK